MNVRGKRVAGGAERGGTQAEKPRPGQSSQEEPPQPGSQKPAAAGERNSAGGPSDLPSDSSHFNVKDEGSARDCFFCCVAAGMLYEVMREQGKAKDRSKKEIDHRTLGQGNLAQSLLRCKTCAEVKDHPDDYPEARGKNWSEGITHNCVWACGTAV